MMRRALGILAFAALVAAGGSVRPARAADDELAPGNARPPDARFVSLAQSVQIVRKAGFAVGRVYEVVDGRYPLGVVVAQRPDHRLKGGWPLGWPMDLRVSAARPGPAEGRPYAELEAPPATPPPTPPATPLSTPPPSPPAPAAPRPPAPAPGTAPPPLPAPPPAAPVAEDSSVPPPAGAPGSPVLEPPDPTVGDSSVPPPVPAPEDLPPIPPPESPSAAPGSGLPPAALPATPVPAPEAATGSPDAPEIAGEVRPDQVPALVGLALTDAETRVRRAGMTLYVERVPGHPVGRVLEQEPPAGATTVPGIVVKVRVTAGGDAPGASAPPPVLDVRDVAVPDVLDRMPPQARRILEDVGLLVEEGAATSGPPGRVVDQLPMPGEMVPKGTVVRIRIAPGEARRPGPPSAAPPPSPAPRETPPFPPGGLTAPSPISPPAGTEIPGDPSVALGFAWRAVAGAEGYVLEVEEQGSEAWLPNVRRTSKTAAATIEVERLSAEPGPLRWRVRAVAGGREGPACPWVVLR